MKQACQEKRERFSNGGYLTACGCIFYKLDVRADGVMVPCIQLSHIELGKINQDDLKDVWQNNPKLIQLRERQRIPLTNFAFCKECDYIPYCTGNCPAIAYSILQVEKHPNPNACLKRFIEDGGELPEII